MSREYTLGAVTEAEKAKAEVERLERENAELRGRVEHWKDNHDQQVKLKQKSNKRFGILINALGATAPEMRDELEKLAAKEVE